VEALQAWGFALRATTSPVAFGYDPIGRSVFFKIDRSTQKLTTGRIHYSTFSVRCSTFAGYLFRLDRTVVWPAAALNHDT